MQEIEQILCARPEIGVGVVSGEVCWEEELHKELVIHSIFSSSARLFFNLFIAAMDECLLLLLRFSETKCLTESKSQAILREWWRKAAADMQRTSLISASGERNGI
jgi:hypothetical protein